MGRQQQHKGGNTKAPAKKRQAAPELDDDMYDEVEQHHKAKQHEDFIALGGNGEEEEESEDEEGVFDLDVDTESSSGDDDDDDEDEDDDGEDEEEGESDDEPPKQRRQKLPSVERAGLLSDEEEEDEDEDEDEASGARKVRQWGKHKQQYYNADATDLEIGQDFGDAEEEEAAAREVEQARYDEMDEEDYVDGLAGSEDEDEDEEEADWTLSARLKKKNKQAKEGKKSKAALAPLLGDLSLLQGGVDERGDVETARVRKDLSKLSKAGKLQVLITDSPELLTLLEEFKEKLGELRDRVEPLVPLARQGGIGPARLTEEGVAYLEVKQQLLLNYCLNLTYYLLLKAEGRAVKDHPVIGQLLELRAALEKMRPLDAKLKYQLDRLLQLAAAAPVEAEGGAANGQKDPLSFRPNPDALVGKTGGGGDLEEDEEEEGEEEGGAESRGGVYRPPRMAAVPYEEGEGKDGGRKKKGKEEAAARKNLEKLRRSELLQTLTEQFSDKPELVAERGNMRTAAQQKVEDAEEERRRFEEDRFIRLVTSKKDKKARKAADQQATRLETIADIGDFHELQASLTALQSSNSSNGRPVAAVEAEAAPREKKGLSALQKAVNSIAQKEHTKKRRREAELEGDVDVPYRKRDESIRVRRPAPSAEDEEGFGGDEGASGKKKKKKGGKAEQARHSDADEYLGAMASMEEDPLYEEVAASKAKRKAEKAALYAVEPRYGAMEDELAAGALGEGEKRGINHQILKNRGLTAYKSKLNRNPRVKKREAYRKAVIKRKGQVRDVRASEAGSYGGETTGINAKVVRVRGKK